ncbi:hypothetical protein QUF73_02160 [Cytobacillus sp. NJ13]|nr:hypothetical protein [Cytobacillus sp. NJ13]
MTKEKGLHETIESLRSTHFNHIPKEIVDSILSIEEESLENRTNVLKKISQLVEAYIDSK